MVKLPYITSSPNKTYDAHQSLGFNLFVFLHGDVGLVPLYLGSVKDNKEV